MNAMAMVMAISLLSVSSTDAVAAPTQPSVATSAVPLIKKLGFHPLNARSTDFELPDLDGRPRHLKEAQGHWLWLTFWATWCGACQKEMSVLETLHAGFAAQGLRIFAISIDRAPQQTVEAYVKKRQLTYPILLDAKNEVASRYQAQSIPTTYLVAPNGRLAGVARGAVDWESQQRLQAIEELLQIKEFPPTAQDQGLTLPENLIPPEMELVGWQDSYETGEEFSLDVAIRWAGESGQYMIKPPVLTVPESIQSGPVSSSSTQSQGISELRYHYPLKASREGEVLIGPVILAYRPRTGGAEMHARLEGRKLRIETRSLVSLSSPTGSLVAGTLAGLGALAGLGVGAALWWRRRSHAHATSNVELGREEVNERYRQAQRQRLSGKFNVYSVEIIELASMVDPARERPEDLLEKIRFGGYQPSAAELRSYEKVVEGYLNPARDID